MSMIPMHFPKYESMQIPQMTILILSIQADMSLVQGAFFAQYLLYPGHYGGKHATHEEVSNFLKLWRANGYYLGISDEFNAVMDTHEETKIFAQMTLERLLKPCMLHLSPEAIHMAKVCQHEI